MIVLVFVASDGLLALAVFLTAGFAIGRIRVAGLSLDSAAILFVAIGLSTANPGIQMPPLLYQFGLALFVYCIGFPRGPRSSGRCAAVAWRSTSSSRWCWSG